MNQALEVCGCRGSDSKINLTLASCQLESKLDNANCKKSAASQCRDAVGELAMAYERADNALKQKSVSLAERCFEDSSYRAIQEAAAYCKGKQIIKLISLIQQDNF